MVWHFPLKIWLLSANDLLTIQILLHIMKHFRCYFVVTETKDTRILHSKLLLCHPNPFSGNDHPLDLSSSLVDLVNLGISHQFLHWVLGVESVATEYLDSVSSGFIRNISGETLKYHRILENISYRSVAPSFAYI